MCPCKWACVHASEMGRCDNQSMWGDKTYLCGEMQVGTDAMRVRGIHVGGSRWNPCENVQVGMDVMSARGHMAMQVGQGGIHAGTCRPAAGGNPWMWVGCMLSMVGVNTVRCCYMIFPPKFQPYSMDLPAHF